MKQCSGADGGGWGTVYVRDGRDGGRQGGVRVRRLWKAKGAFGWNRAVLDTECHCSEYPGGYMGRAEEGVRGGGEVLAVPADS